MRRAIPGRTIVSVATRPQRAARPKHPPESAGRPALAALPGRPDQTARCGRLAGARRPGSGMGRGTGHGKSSRSPGQHAARARARTVLRINAAMTPRTKLDQSMGDLPRRVRGPQPAVVAARQLAGRRSPRTGPRDWVGTLGASPPRAWLPAAPCSHERRPAYAHLAWPSPIRGCRARPPWPGRGWQGGSGGCALSGLRRGGTVPRWGS
jgi:hypothetical protein